MRIRVAVVVAAVAALAACDGTMPSGYSEDSAAAVLAATPTLSESPTTLRRATPTTERGTAWRAGHDAGRGAGSGQAPAPIPRVTVTRWIVGFHALPRLRPDDSWLGARVIKVNNPGHFAVVTSADWAFAMLALGRPNVRYVEREESSQAEHKSGGGGI